MKNTLKSLFSVFDETANVISDPSNGELFEIRTENHGKYFLCAKKITFGGRSIVDEYRIQVQGSSINSIKNKIDLGEKGILLGIIQIEHSEIICAFKVKPSAAKSTVSKQIKKDTINNALLNGFAQQSKGDEYACAFRKELLYFYLSNISWIHDDILSSMTTRHTTPVVSGVTSIGANILLYGVPGSGKSWTIEHEYCKPGCISERIVFHPDYTNADFIGQILPTIDEHKQIQYEFKPGPFTTILKSAYENPSLEHILIIEEINRGNAPAIFGEVFQLLDRKVANYSDDDGTPIGTSEYGITNKYIADYVYGDESHKVKIPSNLSLIGTMNTCDQNVFTLDTAFKRRWKMRNIPNNFDTCVLRDVVISNIGVTWRRFAETINEKIITSSIGAVSSEDKRLGAYFATKDELGDSTRFAEKVLAYLWDDAFKFDHDRVFASNLRTLEEVINEFTNNGSKIFEPSLKADFDVYKHDEHL